MLRYLKNVITGNLYHWNGAHSIAMNDISNRFSSLNHKEVNIANTILATSSFVMHRILGPEREALMSKNITDRQMKSLSKEDHHKILILLYEMFSRILGINDNTYGKEVLKIDKHIFGKNYSVVIDVDNLERKDYLKTLIFAYADLIAVKSKVINKYDPSFKYIFFDLIIFSTESIISKIK